MPEEAATGLVAPYEIKDAKGETLSGPDGKPLVKMVPVMWNTDCPHAIAFWVEHATRSLYAEHLRQAVRQSS